MVGKVSFEGIGAVTATFYAGEGVEAGQVVKLSADATVAGCAAGERFCGVAGAVREGCAPVQVAGLAQVKCEDKTVAAGYVSLTADGKGGVKKAGTGDKGQEYLVVAVDGGGITIKM